MRLIACLFAACLTAAPASAQDPVEAAYEALLAETPTRAMVRMELDGYRAERAERTEPEDDEWRLADLQQRLGRDRALRAARLPVSDLGKVCVEAGVANCQVMNSGSVTMHDGATLYWQEQGGNDADEVYLASMVMLTADGQALRPVYWLTAHMGVQSLETYRADDGPTHVILPAYGTGTGSPWVGSIFRWNGSDEAPTEIDGFRWLDALNEGLPPGLGVWKGPTFNWSSLMAESALWQDSDANCCPTGGRVGIELKIEDDALAIAGSWVEDSVLTVAAQIEPEILTWVSRQQHCRHWGGEDPYDDARRVEIAAAVHRLSCATLDDEEAALRVANAENAATLALLDRAKIEPPAG